MSNLNFVQELSLGKAYEGKVGKWWSSRSDNKDHVVAYNNIAKHIGFLDPDDDIIIDYGCGAGNLLLSMARKFPNSKLIGIDSSTLMLQSARRKLNRIGKDFTSKYKLLKSNLPNFDLKLEKANVLVLCFPHIVDVSYKKQRNSHGHRRTDVDIAKFIASSMVGNKKDQTDADDIRMLTNILLEEKIISKNLRYLLKKGGTCVRIEYAKSKRERLTQLRQDRLAFQEGSLKKSVNGNIIKPVFKHVSSSYFKSNIVQDVFYQTKDASDKVGGYEITVLKAV
ncbi:MAG: class I SAM-dependent methyltransferase [Nitrosotalea sp.]